jgi:hypothetical protein
MRIRGNILARRALAVGLVVVVTLGAAFLASARETAPQRRGGGGGGGRGGRLGNALPSGMPWLYDGNFVFCRLAFRQSGDGDGGGWSVDYPKADLNFPFRLGQLTTTPISRDRFGEPNHVVVTPSDPHLFECPFVMMTEPGGVYFDANEAAKLREYLDKGGFLWVDDFWGEYAWSVWEREIRKVFPEGEFPIFDLPKDHPIFHMQYITREVPQIPSINNWFSTGLTYERFDAQEAHARAIQNARGYVNVVMTHNTDLGDAFEREGENREFFDRFATIGYTFGVNIFLYAMTH